MLVSRTEVMIKTVEWTFMFRCQRWNSWIDERRTTLGQSVEWGPKFLQVRWSLITRPRHEGVDGKAPSGVEAVAQFDPTQVNLAGPHIERHDRFRTLSWLCRWIKLHRTLALWKAGPKRELSELCWLKLGPGAGWAKRLTRYGHLVPVVTFLTPLA